MIGELIPFGPKTMNEPAKELLSETPIEKIYNKAVDIQGKCSDIDVTNLDIDNFNSHEGLLSVITGNDYNSYQVTRHSLSQLCQKIGMNLTYYKACADKKAFELLDENMNYWLSNYDKTLMLRLYNNQYVRGVLSNKYSAFDAPKILERVIDNVGNSNEYIFKESYLSPERLHLRFIQDRALLPDDDLFGGFTIDSSDVGRNALSVSFFIYKQVCTNGLCLPQLGYKYNQRHIGITPDSFVREFEETVAHVQELCAVSVDLIKASKNNTIKLGLMSEEDIEHFVNMVADKTALTPDTVKDNVIPLMTEKYGSTSWGLTNAVTEVAQNYTLERRLELERKAGSLVMLTA